MRLVRAITLSTASVLLLTFCGGDDGGPQGPQGGGAMSAQVNGAARSSTPNLAGAVYNEANEILTVNGVNLGAYSVAITIDDLTGTGTYTLTSTFPLRFAVVTIGGDPGWGSTYQTGGGSLTIATFSADRVAGTFQFTAWPSPASSQTGELVVTAGEFDIPLTRL